jgi:hypothetical protein
MCPQQLTEAFPLQVNIMGLGFSRLAQDNAVIVGGSSCTNVAVKLNSTEDPSSATRLSCLLPTTLASGNRLVRASTPSSTRELIHETSKDGLEQGPVCVEFCIVRAARALLVRAYPVFG